MTSSANQVNFTKNFKICQKHSFKNAFHSQAAGGGYGAPSPAGTFVENTIIIQYDPLVQEVWDQARRLRCTW
jgi:hypothetical protein